MDYVVPIASDIEPLVVTATFDGSGAGGSFIPCLEVLSPAGNVVARCPANSTIAAGGSAAVSWFPWRRGVAQTSIVVPPGPLGTLFAWYDFSDTGTITLDGSGRIQGIADKSGNGHDLSQATGSQRPTETTVNGLNAGLFNHGNQTWLDSATFPTIVNQPVTIAIVWSQTLAGGGSYYPGPCGRLYGGQGCQVWVNGPANNVVSGANGNGHIDTPTSAPFSQILTVSLHSAGSSYIRVNGAQSNGGIASQGVGGIRLGHTGSATLPAEDDALNGVVCEAQYYSGQLSASQLAAVEALLKSKWGTP
jgi:hypothetical protein